MGTDRILTDNNFHNGVDQFPATSPAAYPVGNPKRFFLSTAHNGISGYPFDSFLNQPLAPPITIGEWTLHEANFTPEPLSGAERQYIPVFSTDNSILLAFSWADSGNKLFRLVYQVGVPIYVELREYSVTTPYEISGAQQTSNVATFDSSTQDFFFKDGGNLFVVENNNILRQYTLTSFNLSTLSLVTSYTLQGTNAHIWFKPDGTKLFSGANDAKVLYEYDLSVAWQLSSIAYNSNNVTLYNNILDLCWSDNGLFFYAWHNPARVSSGTIPNTIQMYVVNSAWDVTQFAAPTFPTQVLLDPSYTYPVYHFVLSNSGNSLYYTEPSPLTALFRRLVQVQLGTVNDIETAQGEVKYKNILDLSALYASTSISVQFLDETGVYYFYIANGDIHAHILAEPFNVGTAGSEVGSFSAAGGIGTFTFNKTGTYLYFVTYSGSPDYDDIFHQYSLTAWDLTTAVDTLNSYTLNGNDITSGMILSDDGVYLYTQRFVYPAVLKRFTLSTPFDISTMGSVIQSAITEWNRGMTIDATGTSVVAQVDSNSGGFITRQFVLNTPTDVTTLTRENVGFPSEVLNAENSAVLPTDYSYVEPNGKFLYIPCGDAFATTIYANQIIQIALTSNCSNCWKVENLAYNNNGDISANVTTPKNIDYDDIGYDAYIVDGTANFHHFTTTNKYQAVNLEFESSKDLSVDDTNLLDVVLGVPYFFNKSYPASYRYLYILGGSSNNILRYQMWGTDFTIYFALSGSFSVATQTTNPKAIAISSDGLKLWVLDGNGTIYQYTNTLAYENAWTYDTISISIPDDNDCTGLRVSIDSFNFYVTGNQNKKIYQYAMPTRATLTGATKVNEFSVASEVESANGLFVKRNGDNFQVVSQGVGAVLAR
jgi:hypothetical protein